MHRLWKIGTGLTESSGIFSFPTTGLYLIQSFCNYASRQCRFMQISFIITTDNSAYAEQFQHVVILVHQCKFKSLLNFYLM